MALINPDTLYTGGAVRFDSSPSTNLFLRLQQQRQAQETAKKEALNQYFTDAIKQVNPAGIREVHLRGPQGGILDDIEKWKQWSIQNKNEIAKGGAARMESDMMVSEIARKIQQAKKRDQTFLEIGKSQFEGKFDPDEDDLKIVDKMSRSIYDPESYKQDRVSEYGYGDLSPNLPQYDPLKGFESFTKGMKTGKTFDEGKGRRDPQTGLEWIPYTEKFAEPQIKQIALNAAGEYESNRVAKRYWDNQFKSITEPELAELNKTFKRYFGSVPIKGADGKIIDVSNINTAQDYAAAVTALKAEGFIGEQGEVPKSDYERRQQDKQINIMLNQGKGTPDVTLADYDIFKNYEPKYETKEVQIGKPDWLGRTPKKSATIIKASEVDVSDKKLIGDTKPYTDKDGTQFYIVREDGDWEGRNGQVISRANAARKNMDATSINEVKRGRLSGDIVPKPPVKPKPKNDPLGLLD